MKTKALLVISVATVIAAPAMAQDQTTQDQNPAPKYNRELLFGYANTNTPGSVQFNGFNIGFRQHYNDYFAYGGSFDYGYDDDVYADYNTVNLAGNLFLKLPIKTGYVYAKGGASYSTVGYDTTTCFANMCRKFSDNSDAITPVYGFGVSIPIKDRWSVDASWTRKSPKLKFDNAAKERLDLTTWMLQVSRKF